MTRIPEPQTPDVVAKRHPSRASRGAGPTGSQPGTDPLQGLLLSLQQSAGNRAVSEAIVQRIKVSDGHIGHDLRHKQAARLFTDDTMTWWNSLAKPKGGTSDAWTAAKVSAHRARIEYQQLRNKRLASAEGLAAWLGKDSLEFMYVHEGGHIYTGGRDHEKLPHPTLVGGDPDVICAGTMQRDVGHKIIWITNESGHFRPNSVDPRTVEYVERMLPKRSGKGQALWKAKKRTV